MKLVILFLCERFKIILLEIVHIIINVYGLMRDPEKLKSYTQHGTLPETGRQILKEETLHLNINHESIIKVFEIILIEDSESGFPYLLIVTILIHNVLTFSGKHLINYWRNIF